MTLGEVCRAVRVARGLSQVRTAEAVDIHQSRISEIERDTYSPGLDQARKLAHGLGVNLSDLLAVCEGSLAVEELTDALQLPEGVSLVGRRRKSQAPGKEITARAQRLGFEVLRVVDEVMRARLTPETRGRKRQAAKKARA
jgi:transcriptional regulator with XRE-family HTH domain